MATRLPEIAGDLRWIDKLLEGDQMPKGRRADLRRAFMKVKARANDPELRIAVFGETSSGKSTLLNAFLRERILPSSALVTTRAAVTLRQGESATLLIQTTRQEDVGYPSAAFDSWCRESFAAEPQNLEQALRLLLTTDAADLLKSVEMRSPQFFLGEDIAIIDTPGFSVSDEGHRERAIAAISQADLALVVVPAVAAMSRALVEFLTGPLADYNDRCVFVLTKIDLVADAERGDVVAVVRERARAGGFADPVVLVCAPSMALRELDSTLSPYLAEFERAEAEIAALAAERRRMAIKATALGLLDNLLTAVAECAQDRRQDLATAERELAALSLPDFGGFLAAWHDDAYRRARYASSLSLSYDPDSSRAELLNAVEEAVSGEKIRDLKGAADNVARLVRSHLRSDAERHLGTLVRTATRYLDDRAEELADSFGEQYQRLASLTHAEPPAMPAPISIGALPTPDLSAVDATLSELSSRLTATAGLRVGGGAATGAIIGSFIAPGLGTFLGGIIGGAVSSRSLNSTRTIFLTEARTVITQVCGELESDISAAQSMVADAIVGRLRALRDEYAQNWGPAVARLVAADRLRRAALASDIAAMEKVTAEAKRRREQVKKLRVTRSDAVVSSAS